MWLRLIYWYSFRKSEAKIANVAVQQTLQNLNNTTKRVEAGAFRT